MRHAFSKWLMGSLCLSGVLASCTVFQGGDDDDEGTPSAGSGGVGGGSILPRGGNGGVGGANASGGAVASMCGDKLDQSCGYSAVRADVRVVNMMLVVDKSKSMDQTPDGFEVNKWEALGTALQAALTNVADDINFGLTLYPDGAMDSDDPNVACITGNDAAAVNIGIDSGALHLGNIIDKVADTTPSGGTPTANALNAAYDYFVNGEGKDLQGKNYVLLATDGGPNCNTLRACDAEHCTYNLDGKCTTGQNCCAQSGQLCLDDASVTEAIERLADLDIPTFVVGIPGTEAYASYLDGFAEAGGKVNPEGPSKYYSVSASGGVDSLTEVFSTITTQLIKECNIELPAAPGDPTKVNVAIDCKVIPSEGGENWELEIAGDGNSATLILKGDTCTDVREGVMSVDVGFGCPSVE